MSADALAAITIEQRAGQGCFLVGTWPRRTAFDPKVMFYITRDLPHRGRGFRLGDDFEIELMNARARYRYVEDGRYSDHLICELVRGERV